MTVFANIFAAFFWFVSFVVTFLIGFLLFTKGFGWWKRNGSRVLKTIFVARLIANYCFSIIVKRVKSKIVHCRKQWQRKNFPEAKYLAGNFFSLNYRVFDQYYCLLVTVPEMPWLFTVTDQDGVDRTNDLAGFMGPDLNFHGARVTPSLLGFETLTILCLGCDPLEQTFKSDEILVIDKKLKSIETP
jgi:hypothetical protein